MKLDISIFNPNKANLEAIVAEVKGVTADPVKITKAELELVFSTRKRLVTARTTIVKAGKTAREEALRYQKDVINYEKELIAIISPEENRLKQIEEDTKNYHLKKERRKHLPENKARLAKIGDNINILDKEILDMDPTEFDAYYNQRIVNKVEVDRLDSEEVEKEKKRIADLEQARKDGAKEAEAKAKQDKKDAEAKAKQEEADKLADKKYQAFLKKHNYKKGEDIRIEICNGKTYLYKLIAIYEK